MSPKLLVVKAREVVRVATRSVLSIVKRAISKVERPILVLGSLATVIMLFLVFRTLQQAQESTRIQEQMLGMVGFTADLDTATVTNTDFIFPSPSCKLPVYVTFSNKGDRGTTLDYIEVRISGHKTQLYKEAYSIGALIFPEADRRTLVRFPTYVRSGETLRFVVDYDLGREFIRTVVGEARVACDYLSAVFDIPIPSQEARTFTVIAGHTFGEQRYYQSLSGFR